MLPAGNLQCKLPAVLEDVVSSIGIQHVASIRAWTARPFCYVVTSMLLDQTNREDEECRNRSFHISAFSPGPCTCYPKHLYVVDSCTVDKLDVEGTPVDTPARNGGGAKGIGNHKQGLCT